VLGGLFSSSASRGTRAVGATRARGAIDPLRPVRSTMMEWDKPLVLVCIALLLLGLVMIYSASIALPESPRYKAIKPTATYFLVRQAIFIVIGGVAGMIAFRIPLSKWQRWSPYLFIATIVLLIAVLVPGLGRGANGARRWISLYMLNLQPSEVMKLMVALYAADYAVRKQALMHRFGRGFLPMAIVVVLVGALLQLEPDLGAFMVIAAVAFGILFLGGVNARMFLGLSAAMAAGFVALVMLNPWRRARFFAYLDPFEEDNAAGKAYQLTHSLIAFGRGEWLGVGLGGSVEKLHYLPEAHTDFLLAVIGEELGLVGVAIVVGLFFWLVQRSFEIGRQAIALERTYAGLVAKGIGIWIGVQAFINMGVNLGLLPTKGLTLPLMSYGGSGILVNCVAFALVLRVDYENRVLMRGGRV
jgi:cell division protein FtsW